MGGTLRIYKISMLSRAGLRSARAPGSLLFGAPWTSIGAKTKRKTAPQAKF
jgi:hypothetical protein